MNWKSKIAIPTMSSFTPRSAARRSKNRSRTCNEVSNVSAHVAENNADPGTADQPSFAAAHARPSVRQLVRLQPLSYGRIILAFIAFQTSHQYERWFIAPSDYLRS